MAGTGETSFLGGTRFPGGGLVEASAGILSARFEGRWHSSGSGQAARFEQFLWSSGFGLAG